MNPLHIFNKTLYHRQTHFTYKSNWQRFHIDPLLLGGLFLLALTGITILYSASNQNHAMLLKQVMRFAVASLLLFGCAQIPPERYKNWTPGLFISALLLLLAVLIIGKIGKGAQRWLDLGLLRFQPSELMKIAVPMMVAWYLSEKPLPPHNKQLLITGLIILIPGLLIARQPDLGTALVVISAGSCVLLFAGIRWRLIAIAGVLLATAAPILWHTMHNYQRQRVLTFLNPERDPLGSGYHIIQSKIAIGSGGLLGKGWLNGSQSHLHFLPEHATDFIYAVVGEEFGLIGSVFILLLYFFITSRTLAIAYYAQDSFTRLLAASLGLTFFLSAFINIGMVTGILPVVGLPLPFISYGGTSLVTQMAGFGIIMSIHSHRKFLGK